jgi:hypothetical protein
MRGYLSYHACNFVGFAGEQTGGGLSADSIRLALAADVPLLALLSQADRSAGRGDAGGWLSGSPVRQAGPDRTMGAAFPHTVL